MREGGKYILGALGLPRGEGNEVRYQSTRYSLNSGGQFRVSQPTGLTMRALYEFYGDYNPVFMTTAKAKEVGWELVKEEFGFSPESISIPEGKTEEQVWETVERIVKVLPQDTELIIDVTHGFRTLPMLALQSALLAMEMGKVSIGRIFYGAREATPGQGEAAPFFDLTPLLEIHSWSRALGDLRRFSRADSLLGLLKKQYLPAFSNDNSARKPGSLGRLASRLENLSAAIQTLRAKEIAEASARLRKSLPAAERELEHYSQLRAIIPYLQPSFRELASLAPDGYTEFEGAAAIQALLGTLRYYLRTHAYTEAITLAREILVSLCVLLNKGDIFDKDARKAAEYALNPEAPPQPSPLAACREQSWQALWSKLRDLRNDINHAGFRESARKAAKAKAGIEDMGSRVAEFVEGQLEKVDS